MRSRAARAYDWLAGPFVPNRVLFFGLMLAVGVLIAAFVLVAKHENARADRELAEERQDRRRRDREHQSAIDRIERLERPTLGDVRRLVRRLVAGLTPEQARQIQRRATEPEPFGGGGRSPGTGPQSPPRAPSSPQDGDPPQQGQQQPGPPGDPAPPSQGPIGETLDELDRLLDSVLPDPPGINVP